MNKLICNKCRKSFPLNDIRWRCACNSILDICFESKLDIQKIKSRKTSLWRYREAIPIEKDKNIISFSEGFTSLVKTKLNKKTIYIKYEHLFPTGSFKDRGASVLISKIKELGITKVVEDSSGNAGSAIAAYSTSAGIECHIYIPESTSPTKLTQIQAFGAILHKIKGSREDTSHAVLKDAQNGFYASHSWNPFFFQGTKTFAFEIWEQLEYKAPDFLIIPAGNGTLLIGAYIGFCDLQKQGLISKLPKFVAVQSINCSPLLDAFSKNLTNIKKSVMEETLAEGIAITQPIRLAQMVEIIQKTDGMVLGITEDEIKESLLEMWRLGIYLEPTSAIAFAALKKFDFSENEIIVIPITGNGLKTTEKIESILNNIKKN